MNPQNPTQRMREILKTLAFAAYLNAHAPGYTKLKVDNHKYIDTALAELSKLLDEVRLDELKPLLPGMNAEAYGPWVRSKIAGRIAALQAQPLTDKESV